MTRLLPALTRSFVSSRKMQKKSCLVKIDHPLKVVHSVLLPEASEPNEPKEIVVPKGQFCHLHVAVASQVLSFHI